MPRIQCECVNDCDRCDTDGTICTTCDGPTSRCNCDAHDHEPSLAQCPDCDGRGDVADVNCEICDGAGEVAEIEPARRASRPTAETIPAVNVTMRELVGGGRS
jgi:DnaJ-class molecular chaperone